MGRSGLMQFWVKSAQVQNHVSVEDEHDRDQRKTNVTGIRLQYRDLWPSALRALLANKVRTALTVTGVIVGSACIVLVVTVTLGGKEQVISAIQACGSNLVFAFNPGDQINHAVADELSLDDMEKARELPHVKQVAGTHDISHANVVIQGQSHPVALVGVTEGFQEIRDLVIRQGRFFDALDIKDYAKVCLITPDLAARFQRNMIGSIVHIGELQFTVIGIFQERMPTYGHAEFVPDSVLVPFPFVRFYNGQNYLRTLYVQADSLEFVPMVTDEVRNLLSSQHRKEMKYQVDNVIAILDAAHRISIALTLVLLALACITLLVSGVGIMNIMLVTVTERTPEIGLRRALGARRRDILYQFLIEAGLISGIGAIVGILIAIGAASLARGLVPAQYGLQVPISLPSIVLSFVVSSGVGLVFGYLPARKASDLQPALAVHYE
jgi:putative ABC transport system permease protein